MNRLPFAALLLAVACKSDPTPAPGPESSATPPSPHPAAPAAGPAAAGPLPPNAHGTNPAVAQMAPRPLEKLADGRVALGPFSLTVPAGWTENPSTMSMRAAQFKLPAADGGEGEVIVYYFGQVGAGSVQANIDRWVGQFKQPDDKPSKDVAKIETAQYAGQEASVISVSGRLVASPMPGAPPVDKPDQALVAVIVPSPQGPYYFRLVGSSKVVAAQEAKYRQMLSSLKLK